MKRLPSVEHDRLVLSECLAAASLDAVRRRDRMRLQGRDLDEMIRVAREQRDQARKQRERAQQLRRKI
jgi:hypothetical protein